MPPHFYPLPRSHSIRSFTGSSVNKGTCTGSRVPVILPWILRIFGQCRTVQSFIFNKQHMRLSNELLLLVYSNTGNFDYVPLPKVSGGHVGFSADPGHRLRRDSLYPPYFLNQWENFTKLAWIYHREKPKSWLSFGDFDSIFKVTEGFRPLNFLRGRRRDRFLYARYVLNQWMECHQTCMDLSLGQTYRLIRF